MPKLRLRKRWEWSERRLGCEELCQFSGPFYRPNQSPATQLVNAGKLAAAMDYSPRLTENIPRVGGPCSPSRLERSDS